MEVVATQYVGDHVKNLLVMLMIDRKGNVATRLTIARPLKRRLASEIVMPMQCAAETRSMALRNVPSISVAATLGTAA